jgi:hypothetical protein
MNTPMNILTLDDVTKHQTSLLPPGYAVEIVRDVHGIGAIL